jgi:hypothetical protein
MVMTAFLRPHSISVKKLLLVDGIGAILTCLLLSQLLARMEPLFGMPPDVLYILAGIAGIFAIYSLGGWLFLKNNGRTYLRIIAIANSLYCLTTLILVIYFFPVLTWLGIAYFLGEIALVLFLVRWELLVSQVLKHA